MTEIDLDACAAEPIRIPGGIQPHGVLLAVEPGSGAIWQASANLEDVLGIERDRPLFEQVDAGLSRFALTDAPTFLRSLEIRGQLFQATAHRTEQGLIVEFEGPLPPGTSTLEDIYPSVQRFADQLVGVNEFHELGHIAAAAIRELTGFNRVLLYDFDPDWHGTVFAESNDGALPSYAGLRFPASDIPAQARALYRSNPLRIIPDANYTPVTIVPAASPVDNAPLDLSFAGLRSVSPVHLQYMRNMGTLASMSISIIVDDRLWGLASCHNAVPRLVSPQTRTACGLFARLFSLKVASLLRGAHAAERIKLKNHETELVATLSRAPSVPQGLVDNGVAWLALTGAQGAAVVSDGKVAKVGVTPDDEQIRQLTAWLRGNVEDDVFATDSIVAHWPDAATFAAAASALLAVSISQIYPSYVLWFRPELVRTVNWSGNPNKPVDAVNGQLTPRRSFELWKEQVRQRGTPWSRAEVESAGDFRSALINFVLRRAEERAELTDELERSNSELESFSYSVSHDLRAPFRHIVGYAELLRDHEKQLDSKAQHYLDNIIGAALSAGELVDDLLSFSQLGRATLEKGRVDMLKLVTEIGRSMAPDLAGQNVEWKIDSLPPAWGDATLLRQALANLIENAAKYSRGRDPIRIEISSHPSPGGTTYEVRDNGVGFDMTYVDKLFGVFQRLHRVEDFEGTGIGLALTKRIIERHGGSVAAAGEPNKGARFSFTLPNRKQDPGRA